MRNLRYDELREISRRENRWGSLKNTIQAQSKQTKPNPNVGGRTPKNLREQASKQTTVRESKPKLGIKRRLPTSVVVGKRNADGTLETTWYERGGGKYQKLGGDKWNSDADYREFFGGRLYKNLPQQPTGGTTTNS